MNIYKIARDANVSIATISRSLNPALRHKVSEKTLKKIDALVRRLGYTPNLAAKQLGGARFKTIGIVLPHFSGIFYSSYYVELLAGVADALLDSEYRFKPILLKSSTFQWDPYHLTVDPHKKRFVWDRYNFRNGECVDGLVITHWPFFFSQAKALETLGLPCFAVNDPEPNVNVSFLTGDNFMGGELAARLLYSKGHRKIAILTGFIYSRDSLLRIQGFKSFFKKTGVRAEILLLRGDFQEEKAANLAKAQLLKKSKISAFFCCNDLMAFGVLKALRDLGLSCPRDVSIVGYDDDLKTQTCTPALTTIRVPLYELVKEGVTRLVRHLDNNKNSFSQGHTIFPVRLIERESVANIR